MNRARGFAAIGLLFISFLGACSGSSKPIEEELSYAGDSAGIVSLIPPPEENYFRISGGAITQDVIAIAEFSTGLVRIHAADGSFLTNAAGKGEGPGQTSGSIWIQSAGQNLLVGDARLSRLNEYTSTGELVRVLSVGTAPNGSQVTPLGVFATGHLLVGLRPEQDHMPSGLEPTVISESRGLALFDPQGQFVRRLGSYFLGDHVVDRHEAGGASFTPAIFGKRSGLWVMGDSYYVFDPGSGFVRRYNMTGTETGTFGGGLTGEVLSDTDIAGLKAQLMEESPEPEYTVKFFEVSPVPEILPKYGWAGFTSRAVLTVSNNGDVWLLLYGGVRDQIPTWEVYAPNGSLKGRFTGLDRTNLLAVADDRALLRRIDADGVEDVLVVPVVISP
jgi:hypothetical protein